MVEGMSRDQRFFASQALSRRSTMTPESLKVLVASNPRAPANFRAIPPPANMVRRGDKQVVVW